jgi:hypothetical protein
MGNTEIGLAVPVARLERLVADLRKFASEADDIAVAAKSEWYQGRQSGKADAWALSADWIEDLIGKRR